MADLQSSCIKCSRDTATYFALEGAPEWMAAKLVTPGVIDDDDSQRMSTLLRSQSDAGGRGRQVFPLCRSCAAELRIPTGEVGAEGGEVPCLSQTREGPATNWEDALDSARERQRPRRPSMAVAYSSEQFPDRKDAALAATKAAGCTCEPNITLSGDEVTIKHDHWCAVLRGKDTN